MQPMHETPSSSKKQQQTRIETLKHSNTDLDADCHGNGKSFEASKHSGQRLKKKERFAGAALSPSSVL